MNPSPFPVDIFPCVAGNYLKACQESLNLIPDFLGLGMISAAATLVGNHYEVKIKEGWCERPLFWFAIVGDSGIRKTPSLEAALRPLMNLDQQCYKQYQLALTAYKQDENGPRPIPKQHIVSDTTPEALISTLQYNPAGVLYYKDELIGWVNEFSRYNKGSAEQQWLSIYSGTAIRLNRKKDDEHLRIDDPFAGVIGSIQPEVLSSLFDDNRSASGFTSRIAFSYPNAIKRKVSKANMDPSLYEEYDNFIKRFVHIDKQYNEEGSVQPIIVPLSDAAQSRFYEWDESFINKKLNDKELSSHHKSAISKLESLMPRLALVFQFMEHLANLKEEPKHIALEAIEKAILLTDYFYSHFQKVQSTINKGRIPIPSTRTNLLKAFARNYLSGISKEANISALLQEGFTNSQISSTLGIPKSTVSFWASRKQ